MSGLLEILELELNNVLYFKKARAKLNKNNLTFIRGANLDSDPANPTGNGSGKTLFFSSIANILYFSTPVVIRRRGGKKEILKKDSTISLTFKSFNKKIYKIVQTLSKYTIYENGRDLKIRTIPLAEKFIRRIFPISELEFYTYCFLPSSGKVFQLQADSDANRLEYLTSIFRLNYHDEFKRYFTEQLKTVKKSEVKLAVLEQNLLELKKKKVKEKKNLDENKLKKATRISKELDVEIQELVQKEFDVLNIVKKLETLLSIEQELDTLRASYEHPQHPSERICWLKEQRPAIKAYEKYQHALKAHSNSVQTISAKLAKLKTPTATTKELNEQKKKLQQNLEKLGNEIYLLETKEHEYRTIAKEGKALNAQINKVDVKVNLEADYSTELTSCRATLKLERLLEHKHEGDKCPVCLSDLDLDNIKIAVRKARKLIPKLEELISIQKAKLRLNQLAEQITNLDYDEKHLSNLRSKKEQYLSKLRLIEQELVNSEKYRSLQTHLRELKKPNYVTKPKFDLTSSRSLDREIDICVEIVKHLEAKEKLLENSDQVITCRTVKQVKRSLISYKKQLKRLDLKLTAGKEQLAEVSAFINQCSGKKAAIALYEKEIKTTETTVEEIRPLLEDQKVLETLIKAYGSKGLKILIANKICILLQDHLNHYRDLIFAEPFHFSASASESGLSIKVDRGHGMVSDVRNLSGSESNCFRLLMVLCLLILLPVNRKTNILILDEPDTHMDQISRRKFIDVFLPYLRDIVPNIYIITQSQECLEDSSVWLIKKNQGKSSLVIV